jgi:hypothetical protein
MAKPPRTSSPPTSPDASADHGRLIDEAMQVMSQGRDAAPLYAFVGGLCARLGFPYYSFFIADPMNPGRGSAVDPMIATTYPDAWRTHYISHGFQEHDPVLSAGGSVRRPFTWGDRTFLHGLKGRPRRVIEDARHFGIHSGLSIPVYGPGGDKGVFTVATDRGGRRLRGHGAGEPSDDPPRRASASCGNGRAAPAAGDAGQHNAHGAGEDLPALDASRQDVLGDRSDHRSQHAGGELSSAEGHAEIRNIPEVACRLRCPAGRPDLTGGRSARPSPPGRISAPRPVWRCPCRTGQGRANRSPDRT